MNKLSARVYLPNLTLGSSYGQGVPNPKTCPGLEPSCRQRCALNYCEWNLVGKVRGWKPSACVASERGDEVAVLLLPV